MRPQRESIHFKDAAYFITFVTAQRQPFFRHDRWSKLMIEILTHYDNDRYSLYAYVIMPDYLHLILTPAESFEKAVQMIKGGFSFKAKREFNWKFEIWMPGFTEHRIRDEADWERHINYIRRNPIEAKLVEEGSIYALMDFPNVEFPRGLKP
jgi:putative transposase